MSLQAIAIPAQAEPPAKLLVILHGWGANAQDVAAIATYLTLPHCAMQFPNAPHPFPYAPGGRMWYDLPNAYSFRSRPDFSQQPGLAESRQQLETWLLGLEASTGVPLSQTILGGFSQGGAMTLDVGLRLPIAALVVLSGYLHTPIERPIAGAMPKILLVHGQQDPVVPIGAAQDACAQLRQQGAAVEYHEFQMGHEIQPIALAEMQRFVEEC